MGRCRGPAGDQGWVGGADGGVWEGRPRRCGGCNAHTPPDTGAGRGEVGTGRRRTVCGHDESNEADTVLVVEQSTVLHLVRALDDLFDVFRWFRVSIDKTPRGWRNGLAIEDDLEFRGSDLSEMVRCAMFDCSQSSSHWLVKQA